MHGRPKLSADSADTRVSESKLQRVRRCRSAAARRVSEKSSDFNNGARVCAVQASSYSGAGRHWPFELSIELRWMILNIDNHFRFCIVINWLTCVPSVVFVYIGNISIRYVTCSVYLNMGNKHSGRKFSKRRRRQSVLSRILKANAIRLK